VTYLISPFEVSLLFMVDKNISINGKKEKNAFQIQNCPCGTVSAKIGYVLGLLVHGYVVLGKYSSLIVYNEKHKICRK